jgi:hypothetical protein
MPNENSMRNLIPFKPGQSGNPRGRPKGSGVTDRLKRILAEDDGKVSEALAKSMLQAALRGDHRFVKEILDRVEGKVTDKLDIDGDIRVIEQRFVVAKRPPEDDLRN